MKSAFVGPYFLGLEVSFVGYQHTVEETHSSMVYTGLKITVRACFIGVRIGERVVNFGPGN